MFQKRIKSARILPLADVGIRAWPEQNFLFGILSGSEDGRKWIYNHFIQMRGSHYIGYQWMQKDAKDDLLSICDPLSFPICLICVRLLKKYDTKVIDS